MKRLALIAISTMLPGTAIADTALIFKEQAAFSVCHHIAVQRTPPPSVEELDVTNCISNQRLAYLAAVELHDALEDSQYLVIRRVLPGCTPNEGRPQNWILVFECLTAINTAINRHWDQIPPGEMPGDDEWISLLTDADFVRTVALQICGEHPRWLEWSGRVDGDLNWKLCANSLIKAFNAPTE